MNTILRAETISRSLLALIGAGGGLVACTTQEVNTGSGGASGAGGSGSQYITNDGVACLPPDPTGLITEFTYAADGGSMTSVHFGDDSTKFSGDEYVYPSAAIGSSVAGGSWHISGTVGDYSGFGLSLDNCSHIDAHAFKGISFTVSGTVDMGSMFTMGIDTLNDTIAASWLTGHDAGGTADSPGRCIPKKGTNKYDQMDCGNPTKAISLATANQTILWGDFSGGKPEASVTPGDIISIYWYFPWSGAGSTPYAVDIVIDDLKFIP